MAAIRLLELLIPLLNLLVGRKVTLGSWAMVQRLVRRRALL